MNDQSVSTSNMSHDWNIEGTLGASPFWMLLSILQKSEVKMPVTY